RPTTIVVTLRLDIVTCSRCTGLFSLPASRRPTRSCAVSGGRVGGGRPAAPGPRGPGRGPPTPEGGARDEGAAAPGGRSPNVRGTGGGRGADRGRPHRGGPGARPGDVGAGRLAGLPCGAPGRRARVAAGGDARAGADGAGRGQEGAAARFRSAIDVWEPRGRTSWLARALGFHADALRGAGRRRAADEAAREQAAVRAALAAPRRGRGPAGGDGQPPSAR